MDIYVKEKSKSDYLEGETADMPLRPVTARVCVCVRILCTKGGLFLTCEDILPVIRTSVSGLWFGFKF